MEKPLCSNKDHDVILRTMSFIQVMNIYVYTYIHTYIHANPHATFNSAAYF